MPPDFDSDLGHAATHESAHAVVAIRYGCLIREIFIDKVGEKYTGGVSVEQADSKGKFMRHCVVALAGPAATSKYSSGTWVAENDVCEIKNLLYSIAPKNASDMFTFLEKTAADLVMRYWLEICNFAEGLKNIQPDANGKRVLTEGEIQTTYARIAEK